MTSRSWGLLGTIVLVVLVATVLVVTVFSGFLDWDPETAGFHDLVPRPDATEYVSMASNILDSGAFKITIDGELYPSRYPIGYPLVLAGAQLLGADPVLAPYLVNRVLALSIVLLLGLVLARRHSVRISVIALLLFVTLPVFAVLAASPMSDLLGGLIWVGCFAAFLCFAESKSRWCLILGSACFGLGICVRTGQALLATLPLAAVLAVSGASHRERLSWFVTSGVVTAAFAAPSLIYNRLVFGHWRRTGYDYWDVASGSFSPSHIGGRLSDYFEEFFLVSRHSDIAGLYGDGHWVTPAFVVLALVALIWAVRQRSWALLSLPAILYACVLTLYYAYFGRLFLPVVIVSVFHVAAYIEAVERHGTTALKVVIAALVIASALQLRFLPPHLGALQAAPPVSRGPSSEYLLAQAAVKAATARPCLLVTTVSTTLIATVARSEVEVIGLEVDEDYSGRGPLRFDVDRRDQRIRRGWEEHRCVVLAMEVFQSVDAPEAACWRSLDTPAVPGLLRLLEPCGSR